MTPKEVNGRMTAFASQQRKLLERLDTLAWMIGSYKAQAYHQPRKYPNKPSMVKTENKPRLESEPLDEEIMKTILTAYAEVHNQIEEVNRRDA